MADDNTELSRWWNAANVTAIGQCSLYQPKKEEEELDAMDGYYPKNGNNPFHSTPQYVVVVVEGGVKKYDGCDYQLLYSMDRMISFDFL